jgi:uncharacterized protein
MGAMSEGAMPRVSVVIPVRAEDITWLAALLDQLPRRVGLEILVSSTGRPDGVGRRLRDHRPDVRWLDGSPGRGLQLNRGADVATGRWLWFLHADSRVPEVWWDAFAALDARPEVVGGSFRFHLDASAWQARLLEWGVALRVRLFDLPYGDQGIFVRRDVFTLLGGFAPLPLMEDVEFMGRLKRQGRLAHLRHRLTTSARRWEARGWLRQSASNLTTLALYRMGVSPDRLARRYHRHPGPSRRDSSPC